MSNSMSDSMSDSISDSMSDSMSDSIFDSTLIHTSDSISLIPMSESHHSDSNVLIFQNNPRFSFLISTSDSLSDSLSNSSSDSDSIFLDSDCQNHVISS
ncbi:hypothetical protein [Lactococcus lactis]|uniref:hypothetical protein n=1 Tax=Lactococcus lactis TaxID=1358 RepID=UPI002905BF27|nr:hypothetical protein [Lactococcus lactis]